MSRRYLFLSIAVCALSSCADGTGPDVSPAEYLFRAVAAGEHHTCGIGADSTVFCWGSNDIGQLGNGTTDDARIPQVVDFSSPFVALDAGRLHTCGLTADSVAWCWGDNWYGQLGDGTNESRTTPRSVATGMRFVAISAGHYYTCGLTVDGVAYCWGDNYSGQLGATTTESCETQLPCSTIPVQVSGSITFEHIAAGSGHTCGIATDGVAYCWGDNYSGQLGATTTESCGPEADSPCSTIPVRVSGSITFERIAAGGGHTCGITTDGTLYCWGSNWAGQLGTATTETCGAGPSPCATDPLEVAGSIAFDQVAAGSDYTCAVAGDGVTYCWGYNRYGQLGDGSTEDRASPTALASPIRLATVSAGTNHTCGVSDGGVLFCWGSNTYGELGDDSGALGWLVPIAVWGW